MKRIRFMIEQDKIWNDKWTVRGIGLDDSYSIYAIPRLSSAFTFLNSAIRDRLYEIKCQNESKVKQK